ncbi:protein BUNDLE SHEATH DEFECTIVE 2, chloroplastic [Manihot esculenta]|uniref:Uncharacterized protein n=2 Tax=Manihot esculenta TaxID=3983 RepID=A0ACB7HIU8_MANES|nr:protein BUNDLE SHEATH DEFECTIVE 2, chloroplastic [Manihot esculenta]KAG8652056.1 hypothetical protein MANES_06G058601v8 [Manihot esculenta]
MVNTLCFAPVCSSLSPHKPGIVIGDTVAGKILRVNKMFHTSKSCKFQSWEVKAANSDKSTKSNSLVCADCDGNGAIACSQCKGTGVNSVDHFNGQFKAGGLCWLCRGKRDILCGSCNGAGFVGGFMSTFDG